MEAGTRCPKEVCNGGVACSLLKLGSLEKTVIASLLHSGLQSGSTVRSRFKKAQFKKESRITLIPWLLRISVVRFSLVRFFKKCYFYYISKECVFGY